MRQKPETCPRVFPWAYSGTCPERGSPPPQPPQPAPPPRLPRLPQPPRSTAAAAAGVAVAGAASGRQHLRPREQRRARRPGHRTSPLPTAAAETRGLHQIGGSRLGLGLGRGGWLGRLRRRRRLCILRLARHVRGGARGGLFSLGLFLLGRLFCSILHRRRCPGSRERSLRDERVLKCLVRGPAVVRIRLEQT